MSEIQVQNPPLSLNIFSLIRTEPSLMTASHGIRKPGLLVLEEIETKIKGFVDNKTLLGGFYDNISE